jgi:biotin synthase
MNKKISFEEAREIFELPFLDLIFRAQEIHRQNFRSSEIQLSKLLNIKTGSCPENCSYCTQSAHYNTGLKKEPLMTLDEVKEKALEAKNLGATRFCLGAGWRGPRDDDLEKVCEMVSEIKAMGLETCVTLGLLKDGQAEKLKEAGLDFYNHNVDTSPEFYKKVITTRTFQDRIDTIGKVREAGVKVCCGGILGMGETNDDRIKMLVVLANLDCPPESVPINQLIPMAGTPLANAKKIDSFDFIRIIALARILMPASYVRLSAGRESMSDEMQALCFIAGVNSIFYGDKLLTAKNPEISRDEKLFERLNLKNESELVF